MADPRPLTRRRALAQKSFVKKRRASVGMMGRGYMPSADSLHDDGSFSPTPLRGETRPFRIRHGDDERRIPNPTRASAPARKPSRPVGRKVGPKPATAGRPIGLKSGRSAAYLSRPVARRANPGVTPRMGGRPTGGRSTGIRRR